MRWHYIFALALARLVLKEDQGTDTMKEIGKAIQEGASAFLGREYRTLAIFVVIVAVVLGLFIDPETAVAYVVGAICSAGTGYIGMSIAVRANTRTASAAMRGLNPGLRVAFNSGAVMGTTVVGISIIGLSILYLVFQDITMVAGFGFGASSIALFARVGGGIFTKAADVGSDIVGKVEVGIPEDDPRNPATIADNVGDNVGDVAGMGADLFESYSSSIIATIAIAAAVAAAGASDFAPKIVLPFLIASMGIISSILGTFLVRTGGEASMSKLLWALRRGIYFASVLVIALSYAVIQMLGVEDGNRIFMAIVTGLVAGNVIGFATEFYTSYEYFPHQAHRGVLPDRRWHNHHHRICDWHDEYPRTRCIGGRGHSHLLLGRRPVRRGNRSRRYALHPRHHPGHRRLWPSGRQRRRHCRAGPPRP